MWESPLGTREEARNGNGGETLPAAGIKDRDTRGLGVAGRDT
ncbi:uncharacterized protein G2W53_003530 [Senna tora]|uniref:Uncharacterized protein n=1 Tax=Senna tora TaxID=362788 RepID=A0A835CJC5_9FABA|nr:uncharacterized protein G2W53_003530 [Senna tora]